MPTGWSKTQDVPNSNNCIFYTQFAKTTFVLVYIIKMYQRRIYVAICFISLVIWNFIHNLTVMCKYFIHFHYTKESSISPVFLK
jgi:hypothetical protein